MASGLHTPRRTNVRPSLARPGINTASQPHLNATARTAFDRKASLNALTGSSPAGRTPNANDNMHLGGDGQPLAVGDHVDVPGGMFGVVKFVGGVNGKKGTFVGVELAREYAARGKNDGVVEGTRYFSTSVPGSGIFLPLHRASRRASIADSSESFPPTPSTPGFGATFHSGGRDGPGDGYGSPTPPVPKLSQSVGPGTRKSPQRKKSQSSLSRPGSPVKNNADMPPVPARMPTPGRNMSMQQPSFSKSQGGASRGVTPSPLPNRSVSSRTPQPPKSPSRASSRMDEESEMSAARSETDRSVSNRHADEEVMRLQRALAERDKQLLEQAHSLADMETSLQEIQMLLPQDGSDMGRSSFGGEMDGDAAHLRAILREKNEKISMLTAEFDMHRADFRSTIDTLELASSETVRVYEQRIDDLMAEIHELQEQTEDVESVAEQLKQLEELVQELEEGLEDARRGEAEARGEVEFLRGEVERGRSELRREREKAAQALKNAQSLDSSGGSTREVEQRDDEIRGLKAIIQSLSSGGEASPTLDMKRLSLNASNEIELSELKTSVERLEREKEELRGLIERKSFREEELERELERLHAAASLEAAEPARDSVISNNHSTARDSKSTIVSWRGYQKPQPRDHERNGSETKKLAPMAESEADGRSSSAGASELWCEICEMGGHDILNCTNDLGGAAAARHRSNAHHNELHMNETDTDIASSVADDIISNMEKMSLRPSHEHSAPLSSAGSPSPAPKVAAPPPAAPAPASAALPNPYETGLVAGAGQEIDEDKWCALCERDGHDATACPFEDML